jgi:hypothetical protein
MMEISDAARWAAVGRFAVSLGMQPDRWQAQVLWAMRRLPGDCTLYDAIRYAARMDEQICRDGMM